MPHLVKPNGATRTLKNLGWLLRNANRVEGFRFVLSDGPDASGWEGRLVAELQDGGSFVAGWASLSVCWDWLNRPRFQMLPFRLVNRGPSGNIRASDWRVGDERWLAIQRFPHNQRLLALRAA